MANSETEFQSRSESVSTTGDGPADNLTDVNDTTANEKTSGVTVAEAHAKRRAASTADTNDKNDKADKADKANKVTKRRAPRACASCRARKVRCDVVEQFPCGNCRWDNVDCIVHESRRRK